MTPETAKYIVTHFSHLLTSNEKLAVKHTSSIQKLADSSNSSASTKVYQRNGWLTTDQTVLDLLKNGNEAFENTVATRILSKHGNQVFLNNCPECGRLARTPLAKQCRHCGFDWHSTKGQQR